MMSMIRPLVLFLLLTSTLSLFAQTRIDAGVSIGQQDYEHSFGSPTVLTSAEVLFRRDPFGLQIAAEYADLSDEGALIVGHADLVYRHALGSNFAVMAGAGPTYINTELHSAIFTINGSAELAYHWPRTELFARVRQFDYTLTGFRSRTSPKGPAVYVGVRFALR